MDDHRCGRLCAIIRHLRHVLEIRRGLVSSLKMDLLVSEDVISCLLVSMHSKNMSERISGGSCPMGAIKALCRVTHVWRSSRFCRSSIETPLNRAISAPIWEILERVLEIMSRTEVA